MGRFRLSFKCCRLLGAPVVVCKAEVVGGGSLSFFKGCTLNSFTPYTVKGEGRNK